MASCCCNNLSCAYSLSVARCASTYNCTFVAFSTSITVCPPSSSDSSTSTPASTSRLTSATFNDRTAFCKLSLLADSCENCSSDCITFGARLLQGGPLQPSQLPISAGATGNAERRSWRALSFRATSCRYL